MPEETKSEAEGPVKEAIDTATKLLNSLKELAGEKSEKQTRPGPLQTIGRLFLGLLVIAASATSLAGFLDWRILRDMPENASPQVSQLLIEKSWSLSSATSVLRYSVVIMIALLFIFGIVLIIALFARHPLLLTANLSEIDQKSHDFFLRETMPGRKVEGAPTHVDIPPPSPPQSSKKVPK